MALQEAGITPPPTGVSVTIAGRIPIDLARDDGDGRGPKATEKAPTAVGTGPAVTAEQAADNLRRDARAAQAADETPTHPDAMEHVLDVAGNAVSDEGENLLAGQGTPEGENGRDEPAKTGNR